MSVRLFIGNLPYAANEAELREHLSGVGAPTQVVLPVDRETGRPRGFAFVDYADRGVAEEAIRRFNQQPFKGRPLAVSEARPREERGPGGPPRPGGFSGPRPGGPPRGPAARDRAASRHGPAVSHHGPTPAARRRQGSATATSARTRPPRTSASPRAKTATAVLAGPSRSVRSAVFMTPTRTGAPRTRRSTSTTSRPPPKRANCPPKTTNWTTSRNSAGQAGPDHGQRPIRG